MRIYIDLFIFDNLVQGFEEEKRKVKSEQKETIHSPAIFPLHYGYATIQDTNITSNVYSIDCFLQKRRSSSNEDEDAKWIHPRLEQD